MDNFAINDHNIDKYADKTKNLTEKLFLNLSFKNRDHIHNY